MVLDLVAPVRLRKPLIHSSPSSRPARGWGLFGYAFVIIWIDYHLTLHSFVW
ncbi:hypothetical protein Hanom_Chr09g00857161 [Helianthus anomalus]